jgi:hypothetical protein
MSRALAKPAAGEKAMPICARLSFFVLLGLVAASGSASADPSTDAAAKWKLLGSWRVDCSQPPSQDNGTYIYVVKGGKLFLDRDIGGDGDSSPVVSATINADNSITLIIKFLSFSQTRENTEVKKDDDHERTFVNRNIDTGEYSVRDGILISTGNPTRWYTRCR